MKKLRIGFVERKFHYFVSVENVFRQVSEGLDRERFETSFQQLPYLNTFIGMLRNLMVFRPDPAADIIHVTGHCHYIALALSPARTLLTIHDLGFLYTRTGFRRWLLKKLLLDLPVRRLRCVTAISAATKDEIVAHTGTQNVRVIHDPLDPFFIADTKPEFNSHDPKILQIGTSANKNVENLVRALEGLACRLVLVGEIDDRLDQLLREKNIRYEAKSELNNEELRAEYESADIVAFCSLYEGFGLPIIEAQAMRTPVVTSDVRPMKDVAGEEGAILVDPLDHKSIRQGILRVIREPELRNALVANGIENIKRFDRRAIASQYETIYIEMIEG